MRWVIGIAIVIALVILLDEYGYFLWKKTNPGSLYSHLYDKPITPVDPSKPPVTIYYE